MELTEQENKVIQLKYKSRQLGMMSEEELSVWGKALLLKIHVITGWTIPSSPELLNILIDQYGKYLVEKYGQLNPDEIEYAFRSSGTTVEDWGKAINLNLVDKILIPYSHNRFKLSEIEEMVTATKEQRIFTQDELDNSAREDAERQYQMFLRGIELKAVEINKAILLKDELIKPDESVVDFYKRRATEGFSNIYIRS